MILVEGHTEDRFVKDILNPIYDEHRIFLTPVLLTTKTVRSGTDFKGGIVKYSSFRKQVLRLLKDKQAVVTTLIDYYGLPQDFPGMRDLPATASRKQVQYIQEALKDDLERPPNFRPFIMLHEFEAMLYSSQDVLPNLLSARPEKTRCFVSICQECATPEDINNNPQQSPSHRIYKIFP